MPDTEETILDDFKEEAEAVEEMIESHMASILAGMVKDLLSGPMLMAGLSAVAENGNEDPHNISDHLQKLGPAMAADFDRMFQKYYTTPSSPATANDQSGEECNSKQEDQSPGP